MAILNQNVEWSDIAVTDLHTRNAFVGTPQKTLLEPGLMLCRFITTESKKHGIPWTHIFFSPWWMNWRATVSMLSRFKAVAANNVVRANIAVTADMSGELDSLVQIILTDPVYAWKGIAKYQYDKSVHVTYIGGGEQFYLPNLAFDAQGLSSSVAYLRSFTATDSLA